MPRKFLKSSNLFFKVDKSAKLVLCNSQKSRTLAQGKFAVGQEKHREFENEICVGTLILLIQITEQVLTLLTQTVEQEFSSLGIPEGSDVHDKDQ